MKLIPLRHKLVVQLDPDGPRTTASGLYLGDRTTHLAWGTVESVGEGVTAVAPSDRVLVNTLLGQEVMGKLLLPEAAVVGVTA